MRRTVTVTTTLASPSRRRRLQQVEFNYTRTFTTNTDSAGQVATFTQAGHWRDCAAQQCSSELQQTAPI